MTALLHSEPLRVYFFSDWRVQPLDLAESMIRSILPLDLIVYGGDDTARFVPSVDVSEEMRWKLISKWRESSHDIGEMVSFLSKMLGKRPPLDYSRDGVWTLPRLLRLFRDTTERNRLSELATMARYGAVGVVGNDCMPEDREVFVAPGVQDLHRNPLEIDGWGFIGVEGAIARAKDTTQIGYIVHHDSEVRAHLHECQDRLDVDPRKLVIVSHTPPYGVVDTAIRFGLDHLGSRSLAAFVRKHKPAAVLCGHCHSSGGRVAKVGRTAVINAASDDISATTAYGALVELGKSVTITWVDPTPHSTLYVPGIGLKRHETLAAQGIKRPQELFAADSTVLKSIGFGEKRTTRLRAYERAIATGGPIVLPDASLDLPENLLFYDVETGLRALGEASDPWLIGILPSTETEVRQWIVPEEDKTLRHAMYVSLLRFLRQYPAAVLCSWSGTRFDEYAIAEGLYRWHKRALAEWSRRPKVDLRTELERTLVLPAPNWTLKTVAKVLGVARSEDDGLTLDGLQAGIAYDMYRQRGDPLPVDEIAAYNRWDVSALAEIAHWARSVPFRETATFSPGRKH